MKKFKVARKPRHGVRFLKQFAFAVAIEGMASTRFSSVSEIPLVGLPGNRLVLRRGLTDANEQELERWAKSVAEHGENASARQVVVIAFDKEHRVRRRIAIGDWIPESYRVGPWDNSSDNVVMEEIVLRKAA